MGRMVDDASARASYSRRPVEEAGFRAQASLAEYRLSGLCEGCQDDYFGDVPPAARIGGFRAVALGESRPCTCGSGGPPHTEDCGRLRPPEGCTCAIGGRTPVSHSPACALMEGSVQAQVLRGEVRPGERSEAGHYALEWLPSPNAHGGRVASWIRDAELDFRVSDLGCDDCGGTDDVAPWTKAARLCGACRASYEGEMT